jgi:hypothetical protein
MYENIINRAKLESSEDWSKWTSEIPYIKFDSEWEVKVIPPTVGAIARFHVKKGGAILSVYLDVFDRLGSVGEPYWEVYPVGDDAYRVLMSETDELVKAIHRGFDEYQGEW